MTRRPIILSSPVLKKAFANDILIKCSDMQHALWRNEMDWRYRLRVFPALIYTALIILVCMSGPYHEAPANTRPLFGHSKIMLSSGRFPVETPELTAVIDSGDIPLLGYFTNLTYADFSGSP